jgi:hypothetical protein
VIPLSAHLALLVDVEHPRLDLDAGAAGRERSFDQPGGAERAPAPEVDLLERDRCGTLDVRFRIDHLKEAREDQVPREDLGELLRRGAVVACERRYGDLHPRRARLDDPPRHLRRGDAGQPRRERDEDGRRPRLPPDPLRTVQFHVSPPLHVGLRPDKPVDSGSRRASHHPPAASSPETKSRR